MNAPHPTGSASTPHATTPAVAGRTATKPAREAESWSRLSRAVVFFSIAVGGVGWDLFSKTAIFQWLGVGLNARTAWETGWFNGWMTFKLQTTFNRGALWGMGQGFALGFAGLSVVAALGILFWLFLKGGARSWWLTVSLALIMSGTLGNLYDRLGLHGYMDQDGPVHAVRDFLAFTFGTFHWPLFNFADVFLVTGAIMLVIQSLRAEIAAASAERKAPVGIPQPVL